MIFDPNQTEFADDCQRKVWQYGINIVPPEVSLADIEDEETREGCMQIYNYTMEVLESVWNHPEDYEKVEEWAERWPALYTVDGFRWLFGFNKTVAKKCKDAFALFKHKLPELGFIYDEEKNGLTNTRYPLLCEYMERFLALYKKKKQNMGDYPERCDFRLFAKRVKYTFDDLIRPLSDAKRTRFLELREYALAKGMKQKNCSRYTYKDNIALELGVLSRHDHLPRITIPYGLKDASGFERFLVVAENHADADMLVNYIRHNIFVCDGCKENTASRLKEKDKKICGYYWVNIRDAKRLSCHASAIKTDNPNDEDIQMLKYIIDIRISQIDNYALH